MLKTPDDIVAQIQLGKLSEYRGQNIELKQDWRKDYGRDLSALANRILQDPVWLCVGIANNGQLYGHDEKWVRQIEETISNHINQFLDPQIACTSLTCHVIEGKWFILIEGHNPGVAVYWDHYAYKCSGTTSTQMTPVEVMKLTVSLPGLSDYTAQKTTSTYDTDTVKAFAQLVSTRNPDVPITNLASLSAEQTLDRLDINNTNASRILFGDCKYRIVYYDHHGNPLSNQSTQGLFHMLKPSFIQHIQDWTKASMGTGTDPYPPRALREALSNTVAHAAYVENQGDIVVELLPDHLCISNLCINESEFFANKWFSRSRNTINPLLMETLRLAGFVDELGRGKNLIFADSLLAGKKPPHVIIEKAGRYCRWRLLLYGGTADPTQLRVLARLNELYKDQQKALLANALVLWSGQPVSAIRQYVDGESLPLFAEVLSDIHGPIFYWKEKDQIVLRRWVSVLIGEGKDSKQLSAAEEADLLEFARGIQKDFRHSYITPKELRDLAEMGHTPSEQVQSSNLLNKWETQGIVNRLKKGVYQFTEPSKSLTLEEAKELMKSLVEGQPEPDH